MVAKKPRIVIIGAGMAGLAAANRLYTSAGGKDLFELAVVEGGNRIGGRINTSEFAGDRIEMGATWIHGIGGSPVHKIAQEIHSLESEQPWECMDGVSETPVTVAEDGFVLNPSIVEPVSTLFKVLMDFAEGKQVEDDIDINVDFHNFTCNKLSVGSFLKQGVNAYWDSLKDQEETKEYGYWRRRLLEEAVFAMYENTQRTYTSADDLLDLDFAAESEYRMFPGEEITIAKGYLSIIESLASVLPTGLIQLGRKVTKIEWLPEGRRPAEMENGYCSRPVKLHFCDGSILAADHVIVTVSLGVLKAGIREDWGLFNPPLPSFKRDAISRLGFGVVNKLFVQLDRSQEDQTPKNFPFLQMVFHRPNSELRHRKIPWWMRRTASLFPIYHNSSILLSWFAGKEALELESLEDEEIMNGVSTTISSFLSNWDGDSNSQRICNGNANCENNVGSSNGGEFKFAKVLKSKWGTDPLFLGSYSYVAVGSSGDDLDSVAEPLPRKSNCESATFSPPLQILFAGEATHRTHYSTTHGAYFSGLREASRLLQHYHCGGISLSELLQH
ncbi:probable polyamine oxidase 5 [Malania oleifera]|uniref:probable polyamine oxidase 5 n=1 Tax=Malania oleifera TaxID=397392 RepID=UPI0025ADDBFB|nr:probable polyamine oxidase 5 [Malania oleifera]